ncbi:MAG: hypothetical protein JW737_04815, partial [Acidobacteria bacterium]|nr:hypothetical protein [Acidobacteriota bacterium]
DLLKSNKTDELVYLRDKFLSKIKNEKLKESLEVMFNANPPKIVISEGFLPEYIPDNYTIHIPSKDSPALSYLMGQYICHMLYGKKLYQEMADELLIKESFNTLIRLQNALWFLPTAGADNSLVELGKKMTARGTWLVDLSRFFALVIDDKKFEQPLWLIGTDKLKYDGEKIPEIWNSYKPNQTEGYPLSVLNDVYDHEMFRDGVFYPDEDPFNIVNGLDVILSVVFSHGVTDFNEFEIYMGEVFGNLEPVFREVVLMNNWELIEQRKAEETLLKNNKFTKVVVLPGIEKETEFDKRQAVCEQYESMISVNSNEKEFIQFVAPMDYIYSKNVCSGVYVVLEIEKIEGNKGKAKLKEGPINVETDFETVKKDLAKSIDNLDNEEPQMKEEQEAPIPPPVKDDKKDK